jgi:hypothetical protein
MVGSSIGLFAFAGERREGCRIDFTRGRDDADRNEEARQMYNDVFMVVLMLIMFGLFWKFADFSEKA